MNLFFAGSASIFTTGGNISAAGSTKFEYEKAQRKLIVQNNTGDSMYLLLNEDASNGQEAAALLVRDGETLVTTSIEFTKFALFSTAAADLTGVSKNFTVAAWSKIGSVV